MLFTAKNIDLFHFDMRAVSYPPKDIHTMALEATVENIGALSLEFKAPLRYYSDTGVPYFTFWSERKADDDTPAKRTENLIRPGTWIVILWDEIHTFRETEFKYTFRMDTPAPHARDYPVEEPVEIVPEDKVMVPAEVATEKSEPSSWLEDKHSRPSGFLSDYHG